MFIEQLLSTATLITWILTGVLSISFLIQMIWYLALFSKFSRYKSPEKEYGKEGVSVIICAKNEAENLSENLPLFLKQEYPEYEIVVVNDCSSDNTEEVLMDLKILYPRLRYTTIQKDKKFTHGKKLAVTVGIKAAKYDHLLFSDADCYPVSPRWISMVSRHFSEDTEIILGIGKYEQRRGILNTIVRFETLFTAMQYISFAIKGKAFMGVGRNMGYKKELFFNQKGFASHLNVLSGDDDLFVNKAATRKNTAIEVSKESFTISTPPLTFGEWFKQKKRHLSTGKYYNTGSKIRLATEYFSRMLFYITFIALLFEERWMFVALGVWTILSITKLTVLKLTMIRLEERDLLLTSLLLDPLMPLILGIIRISNIIRPREPKWN